MKRTTAFFGGLSMLLLAPAVLACDYPSRIDIPSGSSSTKEEMIEGQRSVKAYVEAMEEYLDCIVSDEKADRAQMESLTAEDEQLREEMLNKKYNAAVEEMEKLAAQFNAEVRTYKERSD